jgi:parallel beta-helix repeat protein
MTRKTRIVTLALAAAIAAKGLVAFAGDLDPPPGPVAPTHKTLTEVEPRIAINATNSPGDADSLFKITQPGSYYLTGNVTGVAGKMGIEIDASGVTVDLMGFDLVGGAASLEGINITAASTNTSIRNGTVRDWASGGLDVANGTKVHVADMVLSSNTGGSGIFSGGAATPGGTLTVSNCIVESNAAGISAASAAVITDCIVRFNSGAGIQVSQMAGQEGSVVTGCTVNGNSGAGIVAGNAALVSGCTAVGNSSTGISVGSNAIVSNCTVSGNSQGIIAVIGCTVTGCTANSNTGLGISGGGTISGCTATSNGGAGITAQFSSTISDCTSNSNNGSGIQVIVESRILNNTCAANGPGGAFGRGIHLSGNDCRVEGNNVTDNDVGIQVDFAGNLIIRNSASGNTTNYTIAAGNFTGTIVATEAAMNAATNSNINISF